MHVVSTTWSQPVTGTRLIKLSMKLKNTKVTLRQWNKNVFGRVDVIIKDLETRLAKLENELQRGHDIEIKADFLIIKGELEH